VVIYYSGHGEPGEDDHFLLTSNSNPQNLAGTALATADLARILAASPVQQILLILDTCYAGLGGGDFAAKAGRILRRLRRDDRLPSGVYVIAAAGPRDEAEQGVFAREFVRIVGEVPRSVAGAGPPFLALAAVVEETNKGFRDVVPQRAALHATNVSAVPRLLPNLRHLRLPPGVDSVDLIAHWGPTSRSVGAEPQPGWYFTGRVAALSELITWLTTPASAVEVRARVVTGKAGSGKSAVLSRLATLSLPDYRRRVPLDGVPKETIPPEGLVTAAVLARQKTLAECVGAIAVAVGIDTDKPEVLINTLAERDEAEGRASVILLDALDEAVDPFAIARNLLRPLAQVRTVRLLVAVRREAFPGARPDLFGALGPAFVVLDLDDARYARQEDFSAYVTSRLLAEADPDRPTPYRGQPDLARRVGEAVGRRAYPVFLIARLTSESLIETSELDVSRPGWDATFPATVHDAFEVYLDRFGADRRRVINLLRPLAYAEGAGLPFEDLWSPLASVLSGRKYTDDDVEWLLGRAGAFVVEAVEDGRSVYRLYHQALAEHLRSPRRATERQRRIARTLTGLTHDRPDGGGKDWPRANPYVRRHLAAHAAAAGALTDLAADAFFLVAAESGRLMHQMAAPHLDLPADVMHTYQGAFHHLQTVNLGERSSYLEMIARQSGLKALADRFARLPLLRPFTVLWAAWEPPSTNRVIGVHPQAVTSVALGQLNSRPVIVSGGEDGTVRVWSLDDGLPLGEPMRGDGIAVRAVAVGQFGATPVVVSVDGEGGVRLWDLAEGRLLGEPRRGYTRLG
jgi:hypothetical protein